jgi:D-glucuronyl C5-epimerase-like protein
MPRSRWAFSLIMLVTLAVLLPRGETPSLAKVGAYTFWVRPFEFQMVPISSWPYNSTARIPLTAPSNDGGVCLYRAADGHLYDHPVTQAHCIIYALSNYRLSGDSRDLDVATANAERLLISAVHRDGAIFFPYPFDIVLYGQGAAMRSPWFSGMAQGVALSGFVRLWEVSADPRWLRAARETFESFLLREQPGKPWVTVVDGGYLWFEEYPWIPYDHTVNGHVFAAYGLWDYWRLTQDKDAALLLSGALTTSLEIASVVRVPGHLSRYCISLYCLRNHKPSPKYHRVHIHQYQTLYKLTGERRFAQLAELLMLDEVDFTEP